MTPWNRSDKVALTLVGSGLLLLVVAVCCLVAAEEPFDLRREMPERTFAACGLHKLSDSELTALGRWIGERFEDCSADSARLLHVHTGNRAGAGSDRVYFNIKSRKIHCPSCRAARQCTRNCVEISREEALRRGGEPCGICGGRCD